MKNIVVVLLTKNEDLSNDVIDDLLKNNGTVLVLCLDDTDDRSTKEVYDARVINKLSQYNTQIYNGMKVPADSINIL